ncbi:hypothetical protein HZB02_04100 [Candidatus Woesearchaeota archaeon]|nr:hypothetical protein [Candidatus Woesearchaeota archaeon]
MHLNKKAVASGFMVDFFATLLFVAVLVFFYYLLAASKSGFNEDGKTKTIGSVSTEEAIDKLTLVNVLRTTVEEDLNNDGTLDEISIADMIRSNVHACQNKGKDCYDPLKHQLNDMLAFMNNTQCWDLHINVQGKELIVLGNNKVFAGGTCATNSYHEPYEEMIYDPAAARFISVAFSLNQGYEAGTTTSFEAVS